MGTRFIATAESMAQPTYKQMLVDSTVDDLLVSDRITGTTASWLKPSIRASGLDPDNLPEAPGRNYNSNRSIDAAKRWVDVWGAGQGVGAVRAVEPVADVVERIAQEFAAAQARMAAWAPAVA
jgi:nitronate monooxygenase